VVAYVNIMTPTVDHFLPFPFVMVFAHFEFLSVIPFLFFVVVEVEGPPYLVLALTPMPIKTCSPLSARKISRVLSTYMIFFTFSNLPLPSNLLRLQ